MNGVRDRVLDVELSRGDLETPATKAALSLQHLQGADRTLRLLAALGKNPLRRGYLGQSESRDATFSHLIRVSFPGPEDTPITFAREVGALGLKPARLLDLAMFAPQWAPLVADTLGWKGLGDGVYWLHAHTRDTSCSVPQEVREAWEAEISERTPLSAQALTEGTVHRQPGGFLCLIPVHNQHGGRLFLPFTDPDPRTAEVVSKVLLLAEDRKIQDPTILEQLS